MEGGSGVGGGGGQADGDREQRGTTQESGTLTTWPDITWVGRTQLSPEGSAYGLQLLQLCSTHLVNTLFLYGST